MYSFADNKHYKATADAQRTLVCVSIRTSQIFRVPPKKGFDTRIARTYVSFMPFTLHPASEYYRMTLKNPIKKPVLKAKWTLLKGSNFYSEFTYLGISQLTV